MSQRKRGWAMKLAKRISEKTRLMYCRHFRGAHCGICAPVVIARALRQAEQDGYGRGFNEGYEAGHEQQMKMRIMDAMAPLVKSG